MTSWNESLFQGVQINEAACDLAREVANEGDALVAGGVSQTPSYLSCKSEGEVKAIFKKQLEVFLKKNVDFLIAEVNCNLWHWQSIKTAFVWNVIIKPSAVTVAVIAVFWACWGGRVGRAGAKD